LVNGCCLRALRTGSLGQFPTTDVAAQISRKRPLAPARKIVAAVIRGSRTKIAIRVW
jgi:hypothetical protein